MTLKPKRAGIKGLVATLLLGSLFLRCTAMVESSAEHAGSPTCWCCEVGVLFP